jgi:transposase-like protein
MMKFDKDKLKELLAESDVKITEDLQVFMREMMKEVIEMLYEGELEAHLGYKKHESNVSDGNSYNGHTSKKVKSHRCYPGTQYLIFKCGMDIM